MIFDSHIHFDMRKKNPYTDLRSKLFAAGINQGLLILNSDEEKDEFYKEKDAILADRIISSVAFIVDYKNDRSLQAVFDYYQSPMAREITPVIKIHPRLTNIVRGEYEDIERAILRTKIATIVVDDFIYGPQLENHIGTELGLYLARRNEHLRIVLAHAGGCDLLKTLLVARPLPNVYFDYSLSVKYLCETSVRIDMVNGLRHWTNRIMYGTDYPDIPFKESILEMKKLCKDAKLNPEQENAVMYGNASALFLNG